MGKILYIIVLVCFILLMLFSAILHNALFSFTFTICAILWLMICQVSDNN